MSIEIKIYPDSNLGIEKCIKGTPQRNAPLLVAKSDYMLKYGNPLFSQIIIDHINLGHINGGTIIKE